MMLQPWMGPLLAIAALSAMGVLSLLMPGKRDAAHRGPEVAAALALVLVISSPLLAWSSTGVSSTAWGLRIDSVSVLIGAMVGVVGFATLRFARVQLRGEPNAAGFLGWLCLALAAGLLTVFSDHMALVAAGWIVASLCLQAPIAFRSARAARVKASARKFWIDRLSEALLISAIALWVARTGSWSMHDAAQVKLGASQSAIAILFAAAAIVRSAQLPLHGWLLDLLEAPTAVSAILHAGLISAGGILLIRLSPLMAQVPAVMAAIALIGGATALVAGLVQITQPTAKTALVWSTICQMGFMLLECGLGLYPLALLHIVAHGLYKARAFLWASNAVAELAKARRLGPAVTPGPRAVATAMVLAVGGYVLAEIVFGAVARPLQAQALGAILVLGVGYLLAQGLADKAPIGLSLRLICVSGLLFCVYFVLQNLIWRSTAHAFAPPPTPGPLEITILILAVASFTALAVAQATLPLWSGTPLARRLRVHLTNGLYLDTRMAPRRGAGIADLKG